MKFKRPSKRIIIPLAISVAIILVAGIYTWQSLAAWRGYESRLQKEQSEYQELRETALNSDSVSARLEAIRSLDDKLDSRGKLCSISPLYSWQASIVPVLRDGVKRCDDKVKQLGLVAAPLSSLRDYLDSVEKLQQIVKDLAPGEALTEKNWAEKGLEQAKNVRSKLDKLDGSGDAAKLNDKAIALSDALVKEWENLVKANQAKDKTAFLASSAAVIKTYADFTSLADTADEMIQDKVDSVVKATSSL